MTKAVTLYFEKIGNLFSSLPASFSLLAVSLLITIAVQLPFKAINFYSVNYKPCGDTMAALWCTAPLAMLAIILTLAALSAGLAVLIKLLMAKKSKNIPLILATLTISLIAMADFGLFDLFIISYFIFLVPLAVVLHYYIFNVIKKPVLNLRPSVASFALWLLVFICFLGIKSLVNPHEDSHALTPPATVPATKKRNINNRKTYQSEFVSFNYPSEWLEKPLESGPIGSREEFSDPGGQYTLTFESRANFQVGTGKPYASVNEYLNLPYEVKAVTIDKQVGRQPLPKAGSENVYSVVFFSIDKETIYTLTLQAAENEPEFSETEIAKSQKLFKEILSSFKFKTDYSKRYTNLGEPETATALVQSRAYYGPPFDPTLFQLELNSGYLFAKSYNLDLSSYLGKKVTLQYRKVIGAVMGEQQLVIVESIEE